MPHRTSSLVSALRLRLRTRVHRLRSREDGQSLVEFGFVLPILCLAFTGIFAFGITFSNYVALMDATRIGAEQFALQRNEGGDPCSLAAASIASAAPTLKNAGNTSSLSYSMTVGGSTYSGYTPSCSSATMNPGAAVSVTATYPCSLKVYTLNLIPSCTLNATTTEVIQ